MTAPGLSDGALLPLLAIFGLILGSFVTAWSYRLPRGQTIVHGRSQCPACGHALGPADLVPVLSWMAHRGACRYCRAPVPWRYPAIELLSGALFVGAGAFASDLPHLVLLLAMTPVMLALAVIDLEHRRLPNGMLLGLAILALAWRWQGDREFVAGLTAAIATVVTGLALDAGHKTVTGRSGLGMGDTKLFAVAALALPLPVFLASAGIAGVAGVLLGFIGVVRGQGLGWQTQLPFGPVILVAFWTALAAGARLMEHVLAFA